jgi:hypothetical protein
MKMKMITNYLSNLESYLPEDMQQDVRDELEASIYGQVEDLKEQLGSQPDEYDVASILQKMGHPMRVASTYLPNQQLIDSDFYPAYKDSLKKLLLLVLAFKTLVMAPALFSGELDIGSVISGFFELARAEIFVFGLVTLIFYLLQRYDPKASLKHIYKWSPQELKAKTSRLPLKRVEVLFELLFQMLFIAWWNNFISFPAYGGQAEIIKAISLSTEWAVLTLAVNVIFAAAILISTHKLFVAGWQKLTLAATICLNLVILVVLNQISRFDNYITVSQAVQDSQKWHHVINSIDYAVWSFLIVIALIMIWEIYTRAKRLKG